MYDLPGRLLVANPINRYLLNTPMLPNWVKDADGGYTFYIQNESPGKDKEANWLPAPKGPFYMVMRLYLPEQGSAGRHLEGAAAGEGGVMTTDVVIIGGGFAGVTAARELTMRGRTAVLVEARDRLGGRTYTAPHDGHDMELGGTWVHPVQPNVWAEITRYGLELEELPVPGGTQAVLSEGKIVELDDDGLTVSGSRLHNIVRPARRCFPRRIRSTGDRIPSGTTSVRCASISRRLKLSPAMRDAVDGMCSLIAFGRPRSRCRDRVMRVFALSGCSPMHMLAALSAVKLVKGTRALIDAIASQANSPTSG